jgi:hypothetical protein
MIAIKLIKGKYGGYPLKVVYKHEKKELFVITVYPLKRKHWRTGK